MDMRACSCASRLGSRGERPPPVSSRAAARAASASAGAVRGTGGEGAARVADAYAGALGT